MKLNFKEFDYKIYNNHINLNFNGGKKVHPFNLYYKDIAKFKLFDSL